MPVMQHSDLYIFNSSLTSKSKFMHGILFLYAQKLGEWRENKKSSKCIAEVLQYFPFSLN